MCFDPLGTHTRAFITDVRPKLFDGEWKENVGGGDFLQMFAADGKLLYQKEVDPQLHVGGPCLSKAEYTGVTLDESVLTRLIVRGSRTDDMVRVFVDIHLEVAKDVAFSRLFFFQLGSETYSYRAAHERFAWGGDGAETRYLPRTCTPDESGQNIAIRAEAKLYPLTSSAGVPFREAMNGTAPWWVAFENNMDPVSSGMVVGDRGFVVREFSARLGGTDTSSPSMSILCDKVELGPPAGLLALTAGDYVSMSLELLVLPRVGAEYEMARELSGSHTLRTLISGMSTSERVQAQALGGELRVLAIRQARVESHYPVRVFATDGGNLMFTVQCKSAAAGAAAVGHHPPLGFVPIVISGLLTHAIPAGRGLWLRPYGADNFTLLQQGAGNEFWQASLDRATGTYEIVFNIELLDASTAVAFGSDPSSWPPATPPSFPPFPPLSEGTSVVTVLATVVSIGLTITGDVFSFGDEAKDALKSTLQAALSCTAPACFLELTITPASIAVEAKLTIPYADTGSPADETEAIVAAGQALTATSNMGTLSAALGVSICAVSPLVTSVGSVPLAVAPPPPSTPPSTPPSRAPPSPPPDQPPSAPVAAIWVAVGASVIAVSILLVTFAVIRIRMKRKGGNAALKPWQVVKPPSTPEPACPPKVPTRRLEAG